MPKWTENARWLGKPAIKPKRIKSKYVVLVNGVVEGHENTRKAAEKNAAKLKHFYTRSKVSIRKRF